MDFTICDHEIINHSNHVTKGGNIAIEEIFTSMKYKKRKNSLKNRNILFLEQCLEMTG